MFDLRKCGAVAPSFRRSPSVFAVPSGRAAPAGRVRLPAGGPRRRGLRAALLAAVAALPLAAALAAAPAQADTACPGNPDALGTSRVLVVDPTEHPLVGMMQYRESLPLADHEVVLTFDDGPIPPHSTRVLDILAHDCVKATYFLVGKMAHSFPSIVRRIHAEGHTIGTHSLGHPLSFHKMPIANVEREVDGGIAEAGAALGDPSEVAPFFRIPGLLRRAEVERALAERRLMTWSADFPADDWKHISPEEVAKRALERIEARGRGVLLLHDIQPATVKALPTILHELKVRGYKIVHVVPAGPGAPRTATLPEDWIARRSLRVAGGRHWPTPRYTNAMLLADPILPSYDPADIGVIDARDLRIALPPAAEARLAYGAPPLPDPVWPHEAIASDAPAEAESVALPIPSLRSFGYRHDFSPLAPSLAPKSTARPAGPAGHDPAKKRPRHAVAPVKPATTGTASEASDADAHGRTTDTPHAARPKTAAKPRPAAPPTSAHTSTPTSADASDAPMAIVPAATTAPTPQQQKAADDTGSVSGTRSGGLLGHWPFSGASLPRLPLP
ncbi:putative polysaccharide deacetylase precursor protein [Rhodovulum sp. PH10]|nr:putative polysaccharide deacetylase precursor protein [Rhodovulum sp. PH10]